MSPSPELSGNNCRASASAAPAKKRTYDAVNSKTGQVELLPINGSSKRVFDVVSSDEGKVELLPVDGPSSARLPVDKLPDDAVVTIRVFRFLEDDCDAEEDWEKELKNVNTGSLLWLAVHMLPKMHSVRGAKYGEWFTIHHIRVYAKHFKSGYHMCNGGCSLPAKTFGATSAVKSLVTGRKLQQGYFWFVSPCEQHSKASLANNGWEHISVEGPFDGRNLVEECDRESCSVEAKDLQEVVRNISVCM
eukprot:CAMPEP_0170593060 /NCGR_PEP_ID=MMETSP0224-20130122/13246_1 /TAXON_ID=285029 /ORGANISM="Togula jolla, Strain CCCM 725" /LENGTH=246 /DNA_ID=CAMNT_0010916987 /DNA_START=54 /DNA_END=794 /DNA_ORIENTATION=+